MRQESMLVSPHSFMMGPFIVQCLPYFYGLYSLYIITADGVEVQRQISYPEAADGWHGISTVRRDTLSLRDKDTLDAFARRGHERPRIAVKEVTHA